MADIPTTMMGDPENENGYAFEKFVTRWDATLQQVFKVLQNVQIPIFILKMSDKWLLLTLIKP